ncbi:hypothetical protein INT44_002003 [Umbelopsis vinacea]|uniref:chitin synthase n=1 Tax=Umbelopsis vinacea TaxID=44442 RepID=A0A8H7UMH3_9FUNG|nr:hypothetical protein INT44_002003 [Umbelopsis vinacea]
MQEDGRSDLSCLLGSTPSGPTEESVTTLLQSRFKRDLPYTRLGQSTLVVVNPFKPLELLNDAALNSYAEAGYRDVSGQTIQLQPHVYDLATRVYFHMRRSGEDQSIILSGITGSGKTTTHSHLLNELLLLSTHSKKETKLQQQIHSAQAILDAFGCAYTSQNVSASKFGKFQELQFNERGRIIGAKTLAFGFDKSRTTITPKDERSYNVFYSLLAGTNVDEKNVLQLNYVPEHFIYLAQSKCIKVQAVDDDIEFGNLKAAFKKCGFKAKTVMQIFQVLSAILHLGNLQFIDTKDAANGTQDAASIKNIESLEIVASILGISPAKLESCLTYQLKFIRKELCTVFLNASAAAEQRDNFAQSLYKVLFLWIVEQINTKLCYTDANEPANFIAILDQFGFQNFRANGFEQFCVNFSNERVQQFIINERFNNSNTLSEMMEKDGIKLPQIVTMDNAGCLELLCGKEKDNSRDKSSNLNLGGVIGAVDRECARYQTGATDATDANLLLSLQKQYGTHPSFAISGHAYQFGINHFSGTVHYAMDSFLDKNLDALSPDFVNLLRSSSTNNFVSSLFQSAVIATESHPKDDRTIVKAQLPTKPVRAPSMKRVKRRPTLNPELASSAIPEDQELDVEEVQRQKAIKEAEEAYQNMEVTTVMDQLYMTLRDLFMTMSETRLYNVIHLRPNDVQTPDQFDTKRIKTQIRSFLIPDLIHRCCPRDFANYYTFGDFLVRYENLVAGLQIDTTRTEQSQVEAICASMGWIETQAFVGHDMVWLDFSTWKVLEDSLRAAEKEERQKAKSVSGQTEAQYLAAADNRPRMASHHSTGSQDRLLPPNRAFVEGAAAGAAVGSFYDDSASYMDSEDEFANSARKRAEGSQWGEESDWGGKELADAFGPNRDMSKMIEDYRYHQEEHVEEVPITSTRIWWVRFVWLMTFWIPTPFLRWFGKMKREDVQMAWREKVTICLLIFLFSGVVLFFIVGLSPILCPGTSTLYSATDVGNHNQATDFYVSIAGKVWDLTTWVPGHTSHGGAAHPTAASDMAPMAGTDISYTFPPPMTQACPGLVTSDTVKVTPNTSVVTGPFIHTSGSQQTEVSLTTLTPETWYFQSFLPEFNKDYLKGDLVHKIQDLNSDFKSWSRLTGIINGKVYDITDYMTTAATWPPNVAGLPNYHYLDSTVEGIFQKFGGGDMTDAWNKYTASMNATYRAQNLNCLDNAFYIGRVDYREDLRCVFANYLLLAFALVMCSTIIVKFLAALQFGGKPTPEDHDKFVICQVPCYTEGEESIKKTIDSLTAMTYDDKRKLLFIIADGMVMGSGNDRPTPRIVLDVLGHDPKLDPEPLMFKSIGEGSKQLNYGKVYSGLYEFEGHVVPYIVVVKVGKASERSKPGNRGKRDSQIICMNFLNKVHFESEMTPLELEIYHQMKNVIGVNPSFYEYALMVDSDTEVEPDALTRMVSCMLHDGRVIGLCGETKLVNEDNSWTTMIQVYEYYISHHLSKAFESLFGSVTCLPGCFCMYRIRTPTKNTPLIISPKVIKEYSDNQVDTLHKKNLLHLGEDRYLTTLMMKHFPQYKMKFTPHAQCKTVAPDRWKVLLSQRRRWINSTVHNFLELVFLPELCGFCCFSMRFVVIVDLIGTMTLPVSVVYLVYLIYVIASGTGPFPKIALIMLAGIYALQAIIFLVKRQWQYIGWMIIYILAIPIFSFFIPVYSFWHFDDFSWGNTRVVIGDNKKKQIYVADDEKFDDKMIPLKKWSTYEQELWEMASSRSGETGVTQQTYRSHPTLYSRGPAGTVYSSHHGAGSQENFDYYRDTNPINSEKRGRSGSPMNPGGSRYAGSVMQDGSMYGDYMRPNASSRAYSVNQDYDMMQGGGRMTPAAMSEYDMVPPSRPMSQYSMPMSTLSQSASNTPPGFPRDAEIIAEIKNILATANLMSITKKQVREQLSAFFGFDLNPKKEFINTSIEYILQGRL